MIAGTIKKWGNSFGLLISKNDMTRLNLAENQKVIVDITQKMNPLKELFGLGKKNKITKQDFLETRQLLEGKP